MNEIRDAVLDGKLSIVCDSREQWPFLFAADSYAGTKVEQGTLATGDYSLRGLENRVAVERKGSLDELCLCLGRERERFERELARARGLDAFTVVIEGTWEDLVKGRYRSKMRPASACASIMAFMARGTSFMFCGSRNAAEWVTYSFLRFYAQDRIRELRALEKSMGAPAMEKNACRQELEEVPA